jgi:RNA polymerase sigma-70 factor (ECF subfamily)
MVLMLLPAPERDAPDPVPIPGTFREIFEAHARFVWRSLLGFGVAESDVADASQQVFLVLHQKLGQIVPGCSLRTFAYGICLRVAADYRGRAHARHERPCSALPEPVVEPSQEGAVSRRQALRRLREALDRLEPAKREVFVLYEIEELTMKEVAGVVGCPLQTAYSRLHAARKEISTLLADEVGPSVEKRGGP